MIFSENQKPTLTEFTKLCVNAESLLNAEALRNPHYFLTKGAQKLEPIVLDALNECATGTDFEGSLSLVSGLKFPDIVAKRYYGVEVKSTKENKWQVIGGSVAEGTRVEDVENIFLMFGKLHNPVQFKTRRYQDCLYDVAVTHSPRYKIDMQLAEGETIFDKIGIDYDTLRQKENPLEDVVNYYRTQLQPGESLWWVSNEKTEPKSIPLKISLWKNLSAEEKDDLIVKAIVFFPEIFSNRSNKYERFAVWLVNEYGVVSTNVRDNFSAGGKITLVSNDAIYQNVPQLYSHIVRSKDKIIHLLQNTDSIILKEFWGPFYQTSNITDPITIWFNLVENFTNRATGASLRRHFLGQNVLDIKENGYSEPHTSKHIVSDGFR